MAQTVRGPAPSVLWSAAGPRDAGPSQSSASRLAISRREGFALGSAIGGVAAGFFGHRMCRAYGTRGDCWGTAAWWGVIGGMLGGLIGAGGGESDGVTDTE